MVITTAKPNVTNQGSAKSSTFGSGRTGSAANRNLSSGAGFGANNLRPKTVSQAKNNIVPFNRPVPKPVASSRAKGSSGIQGVKGLKGVARLGMNAKGDISLGVGSGSVGASVSAKGDISLGLGVVSITIDPKNLNNSALGIGLNTMTIEGKQEGCTTTLFYKILGKVVNTETRIDPGCTTPEPITKPDPSSENDIRTNNKPLPPTPATGGGVAPIPVPLIPGKTYAIMYEGSGVFDYYKALSGDNIYWFIPLGSPLDAAADIGDRIIPILNRLSPGEKIAFYEALGTNWTFAPWTNYKDYYGNVEQVVPRGQNNAGVKYLITTGASDWLQNVGGSNFEPNFFRPNQSTRAYLVWSGAGFDIKIDNFPIGPSGRTKWFPGTPNAKIIEIPPLKPKPKTNTPRSPIVDNCCEELKETMNDIYDMLGGDNFRDDGLEIPNHLYIPGGKGDTKAMTYNTLINLIFRTLDHRTCGEVEIAIKDNNIMKEGDQGYTFKAINNTAAIAKIMEISQKQDADLSALLNLLIRLNWIAVQILKVSIVMRESIKAIIGFFGIPVRDKVESIDIPVDPSLGGKVGFDPKKPTEDELIKLLNLDDPEKTIKILDKFMNNSKIPVTVKKFIGDAKGGNFWWLMDKKGK